VRPAVSDAAERLFTSLGPWSRADSELTGWALLHFCESIAGRYQDILSIVESGDDGEPGWSAVLDANRAPATWLPWLAQFVGVRLPPGLSEEAQRLRIKSTDGFRRGSPDAVRAAAKQYLIGPDGTPDSASVFVLERHGSPYRLTVSTYEAQTPDVDKVYQAVLEQKPAGLVLNPITVLTGVDYLALRDTHVDYTAVRSAYTDYSDVLAG
jgi:hypothetical protein